MKVWILQWKPYAPGFEGAANVIVFPGSIVMSNPPPAVSADTVCSAALSLRTVTVPPALTGMDENFRSLLIVIVGPVDVVASGVLVAGPAEVSERARPVALLLDPQAATAAVQTATRNNDFRSLSIRPIRSRGPPWLNSAET